MTVFILQSCEINESTGEIEFTWLFWALLVGAILFFVFAIASATKDQKKNETLLGEMGIKKSDFVLSGTYVGGHVEINDTMENSCLLIRKDCLEFCKAKYPPAVKSGSEIPEFTGATIPLDSIEDVSIEDRSQIQNKITAGRLLLVGVFALAWRKKKLQKMQFVVVKWKSGKFENETTFMFEGEQAMTDANILRNSVIKAVNAYDNASGGENKQ